MASNSQVSAAAQETSLVTHCSICLEEVNNDNSRAITKLICGHTFHLSCIGCQFNLKGAMECPVCRTTEANEWLFCIGEPDLDSLDDYTDEEISPANADPDQDQNHNDQNQNHNDQTQNHNDQNQNHNDQNQYHNYQNQNILQYQNQNIFQCPQGVPNCQVPRGDYLRPIRALQIGGGSSSAVFPGVGVHQHNNFPSVPAPSAPPFTPFHASNISGAAIGFANNFLNPRPFPVLDPVGSAPFLGRIGGHGSSHFPSNRATEPILRMANPPSTVLELFLGSSGGPNWATPREMNVVGLEPSVYSQGTASTTSADRLELNVEQPPHVTDDDSGNPNEAMNSEEPNSDAPKMIRFL